MLKINFYYIKFMTASVLCCGFLDYGLNELRSSVADEKRRCQKKKNINKTKVTLIKCQRLIEKKRKVRSNTVSDNKMDR